MKQATFVFQFDSPDDARVITASLFPEVTHKIPKTTVSLSCSKRTVTLRIESSDVSSLRAACNSYVRWIHTALAVKHVV